jgi:hypothetical protein
MALAALFVLVLPVRVWVLWNTEVAARDSIGYIRFALQFEQFPWQEALQRHDQHPGYSLAILALSEPLRFVSGRTDAATMQFAAQLVSVVAALLLLYPMYHLGRLLFDRRVGFGGALLFQYLPISGHHLSDAISETLFLLLVAAALLQGVRAVQNRSLPRFAACGVFVALGYLTRPEAGLVAAAMVLVLCGLQLLPAWRMSWQRFAMSGVALTLMTIATGIVLYSATGHIVKHSVRRIVGEALGTRAETSPPRGAPGGPLFAVTFQQADHLSERVGRSTRALAAEVANGYHFGGVLLAIVGLAWSFGRLRRMPGFWVLVVYYSLHTTALFLLAMTVAYVSDRHVMSLVMCGSYFVVAGLGVLARGVRALIYGRVDAALPVVRSPLTWSLLLLATLGVFCLPKTLQRLHANRAGNHAAGLWLAEHLQQGDVVVDDHSWSHYYSGQLFQEDRPSILPAGATPRCYTVVTRSRSADINQDRQLIEQKIRDEGGALVYHWPETGDIDSARVVVYAQPREMKKHPWQRAN